MSFFGNVSFKPWIAVFVAISNFWFFFFFTRVYFILCIFVFRFLKCKIILLKWFKFDGKHQIKSENLLNILYIEKFKTRRATILGILDFRFVRFLLMKYFENTFCYYYKCKFRVVLDGGTIAFITSRVFAEKIFVPEKCHLCNVIAASCPSRTRKEKGCSPSITRSHSVIIHIIRRRVVLRTKRRHVYGEHCMHWLKKKKNHFPGANNNALCRSLRERTRPSLPVNSVAI